MSRDNAVSAGDARYEAVAEASHRPTLQVTILSALYVLPAAIALRPIIDVDIWWHLREGAWIAEHRTVPVTDPFTSYGLGKTWIAYSWLYELLVHGLYHSFGLFGVVLYTTVLGLGITFALHHYLRRQTGDFFIASGLTALGVIAMFPVLAHPRPWLFNVLFVIVELALLLDVRKSGSTRPLWLLPPLFFVWACINIQFVYGLFILVLGVAEPVIEHWARIDVSGQFRTKPLVMALFASIAATCLTPYHITVYLPVITAVRLTDPFLFLAELQAPSFRHPFDWLALGLLVCAAFVLGRQRTVCPFLLFLLLTGGFVAFRARRDVWFLVIASMTVIAMIRMPLRRQSATLGVRHLALVGAIVVAASVGLSAMRASSGELQRTLSEQFPVDAAAFVEQQGYSGRLYNHYDWGGYLMWRLPSLDVSLDGRNPLHGDQRIWQSIRTWRGHPSWASDPELANTNVVIADISAALTSLLRHDSRFELVYEDHVAAVFIHR